MSSTEAGQVRQDQGKGVRTGRQSEARKTLEITTTAETQTHSGKVLAVTQQTVAMSFAMCQRVEPIQ